MIKNSELAECGSYLQTKILQLLGSKIPNRIFHFSSVVITRNSNKRVVHQTKDEDDVEWSGTCGICGLSQDFRITFAKHAELHSCFLSPGKHLTWPFFFFFQNYILTDQPCYSFCIWESLLCVLGTVLSIWMFKTQFYWNIWLIWGWSTDHFGIVFTQLLDFVFFFFIIEMMLCMIDWLNAAMTLHVFLS